MKFLQKDGTSKAINTVKLITWKKLFAAIAKPSDSNQILPTPSTIAVFYAKIKGIGMAQSRITTKPSNSNQIMHTLTTTEVSISSHKEIWRRQSQILLRLFVYVQTMLLPMEEEGMPGG